MERKFYLTTSLPYINSHPHVGFALEAIQADVVARWRRLQGERVFFLTGTDEHGSKVAQVAGEAGVTPQVIAERNSSLFAELKELLNLSTTGFIRTSDRDNHWPGAQLLWQRIAEKGDLYRSNYRGLYCVGCEAFITEKELVDGQCPIHRRVPEVIEEENYFFKLSAYGDRIASAIRSGELKIIPAGRAKEILNVIDGGLTDISFSRPAAKLPWGIPVPDDPTQTMYVWCDALSNYITGVGFGRDENLFANWWPADLHVIGKDILRFHTAIWPAMLMSAGLLLPRAILVHGFITSGGQKMSKSLGNVVDPVEVVAKYGTDALRYYLMKEIPATDDGDFSWRRFEEVHNGELANNFGNLIARVLQMAQKFTHGQVPEAVTQSPYPSDLLPTLAHYWEEYDFAKACHTLDQLATALNILIDEHKPWELAKSGQAELLDQVMYQLLEGLRILAIALSPVLPSTAARLYRALGQTDPLDQLNWLTATEWGQLPAGQTVELLPILFPKSA